MNRTDYADDPFKAMVRRYDHAVVAKGDRSIFTLKPAGAFQRAFQERAWRAATPHVHDDTPGRRPHGRAIYTTHGDRPLPLDDWVFE